MPVTATPVTKTAAKPPHIDGIGDFHIYQSLRLAYDQIQDLKDRLTAAEATIASIVSTLNTVETNTTAARKAADEALAIRQEP